MSVPPAPPAGRRVLVNTASLATASLWRIGIAFLLQILIARRYNAAALGDYAITLAWLHVGQIVTEAGLPALFVREVAGRPERRRSWLRHIRSIQIALGFAAWAALVGMAALVPAMQPRLLMIAAAGASLPFYAVYATGLALFEGSERMERSLLLDALPNALLFAATIAVVWVGGSLVWVVGMITLAQLLSAALAWLLIRRSRLLAVAQEQQTLHPRATLRRAAPFFGLALTDVFQQRADLLLLGGLAAPAAVGLYAAAASLVRVLIKVMQSYGRALYPTFSRLHDSDPARFQALAQRAQRYAAVLTLGAAAIGAALAAPLLATIFGPDFTAAAPLLALLLFTAPSYALELLTIQSLLAARRPRLGLAIALGHTLLLALLLPTLIRYAGVQGAAWASLLSATIAALAAYALAPQGARLAGVPLAGVALSAAGAGLTAWGLGAERFGPMISWWVALPAALLVYALLLLFSGSIQRSDLAALR